MNTRRGRALRCLEAATILSVAAGCGGATSGQTDGELVTSRSGVQLNYVSASENSTDKGVNLLTASSTTRKGRATGAIRRTQSNGARGNCGATFLSHHWAVTAGHCVPFHNLDTGNPNEFDVDSTTFKVQQFDTTALSAASFNTQAFVDGTWPDYFRPNKLNAASGYKVTEYNCTVHVRCRFGTGSSKSDEAHQDNCPFSPAVDTALIHCPDRPDTGQNWVPVRAADPQNLDVEVWWFHEVVNLSTDGNDYQYQPSGNADHYMYLNTGGILNNYHYWHSSADTDHQVLPLRSKWAIGGDRYSALKSSGAYTDTTVPGCHGTSGSGVFAADSDDFLGNVVHGGWWSADYLCSPDLDNTGASTQMELDYAQQQYMLQLEAAFATGDRAP